VARRMESLGQAGSVDEEQTGRLVSRARRVRAAKFDATVDGQAVDGEYFGALGLHNAEL